VNEIQTETGNITDLRYQRMGLESSEGWKMREVTEILERKGL
jgi:hypothetical protein